MGTELPTKVMLDQTLVLMQMTFLNNVRKIDRLVHSRTSCHTVNIISQRQYFVARGLSSYVRNVCYWFTYYVFVFILPAS
jgi:hypothetical protein